jgi:hypothetical protein
MWRKVSRGLTNYRSGKKGLLATTNKVIEWYSAYVCSGSLADTRPNRKRGSYTSDNGHDDAL